MEISELEIKGFQDSSVERLLSAIHDFNGSQENITQLYDVLTWIENHEVELSKPRRILEKKTIDYRFKV